MAGIGALALPGTRLATEAGPVGVRDGQGPRMKSMTMGPFENDPSSLAKPGANIKELKQHITMAVLQTTAMREVVMTTKHQLVPLTRGWHGPGPWSGWGGSEHGGAGAPGQGYAGTASRSGSTSATPSSTWDWLAARARMKLRHAVARALERFSMVNAKLRAFLQLVARLFATNGLGCSLLQCPAALQGLCLHRVKSGRHPTESAANPL